MNVVEITGETKHLSQAVQTFADCSQGDDTSSELPAMRLGSLSAALGKRYDLEGAEEDFTAAIEAIQESIRLTPNLEDTRAVGLNTLSRIYYFRFSKTNRLDDINCAVSFAEESISISNDMVRGESSLLLGQCLRNRYELAAGADDLVSAIEAYGNSLACSSSPTLLRIHAAVEGGQLASFKYPRKAYEMLSTATRLLSIASPRGFHWHDQQFTLSQFRGLASAAAALCINSGEPIETALRLLKTGRGVMANSQLKTRSNITDLEKAHPELALRFKHLRDRCDYQTSFESYSSEDRDPLSSVRQLSKHYEAFQKLDEILQSIRAHKGFERFLLGTFVNDMKVLASTGPIIYMNTSRYGSDAFIILSSDIQHLRLHNLKYDELKEAAKTLTAIVKSDSLLTRKDSTTTMRTLLEWLWDVAIEPILKQLGFTSTPLDEDSWPHVWWIPVGMLSVFPFHAAGYTTLGRRTLDRVILSYVPKIRALKYAREKSERLAIEGHPASMLLVSMPTTPKHASLPFATREVEAIGNLLATSINRIILRNPTKSNVVKNIPQFSIAHFACHGSLSSDPSKSQIILEDWESQPLSITDIARLKLEGVRLAYLSACHAARNVSFQLLDEAIHMTGACQLAGFPTVIGTLWHVSDMFSAMVAENFYRALLTDPSQVDFTKSARALHFAVRKVMKDNNPSPTSTRVPSPITWAPYVHVGV